MSDDPPPSPLIPENQTLAAEMLTKYATLLSPDFMIGIILSSTEGPVQVALRAELDRRLALLEEFHAGLNRDNQSTNQGGGA